MFETGHTTYINFTVGIVTCYMLNTSRVIPPLKIIIIQNVTPDVLFWFINKYNLVVLVLRTSLVL